VGELQERMSYAEFVEWHTYAQIEPLPEARADLRNALQMLLLIKVNQGKKQKKLKLETFLPDWWDDRKDPRRLAAKFRALTAHLDNAGDEDEPGEDAENLAMGARFSEDKVRQRNG